MAARWRERVSEAERPQYGAGLLGTIFMVLAERRLPVTHAAARAARVVKAALWTAAIAARDDRAADRRGAGRSARSP